MAYVYEPMSDDDWKKLLRLNPGGFYISGRPRHWCNDREKDIQFVSLGGRGYFPENTEQPPNYYLFIWHGHIIRLESRYTSTFTGQNNHEETVAHKVYSIYAPMALEAEEHAIREEIPVALLADWRGRYARNIPSAKILAVHATISPIHFISKAKS